MISRAEMFQGIDLTPDAERLLRLVPEDPSYNHEMPDAEDLVDQQTGDAIQELRENTRGYPCFPWPTLDAVTGPMCPGDLIMVAARTGNGKSLFLQNLFDALVVKGLAGLYVGLEQGPSTLRRKWACIRADVRPSLVMATKEHEYGTHEYLRAMDLVEKQIAWQRSEMRKLAHFSAARRINAKGLKAWTDWAVERDCRFVMIDHIDRVQHGDGSNSFHELSETVRLAKELAVEHRIVMLVASQVGRPSDALEQFMPPSLHNMRGAGTKEEEADAVLGVYRPLKKSATQQQMTLVRQGLADRDTVIEPNAMGVMVLKHRLDGVIAGKSVILGVEHQRIHDLREADRWETGNYYPKKIL